MNHDGGRGGFGMGMGVRGGMGGRDARGRGRDSRGGRRSDDENV